MCVNPSILDNGHTVACRICWQCRERRINDWAGRCIAESKTAVASNFITLTYGRDEGNNSDHLRARLLTYSDIQLYLKLLRRHGYPLRYLCAGEYGSEKGRAHWHLIVFWQDKIPLHELDERFEEPHWPHGLSQWEAITPRSARYVCKYIQKDDEKALATRNVTFSKNPPIGAEYFKREAQKYVAQGLAPQTLEYSFSEAKNKEGKKQRFVMFGKTADLFLKSYVDLWSTTYPGKPLPNSDIVREYLDPQRNNGDVAFAIEMEQRSKFLGRPNGDQIKWFMDFDRIRYSGLYKQYYYEFEGNQGRWYWGRSPDGTPEWQENPAGTEITNKKVKLPIKKGIEEPHLQGTRGRVPIGTCHPSSTGRPAKAP